jgi:gas vesicle protein
MVLIMNDILKGVLFGAIIGAPLLLTQYLIGA